MNYVSVLLLTLALAIAPCGAQTKKGTAGKKAQTTRTTKKSAAKKQTTSISGLRNQRAQIKKQIKTQQQKLRNNERDVKQRLQNLMVINSEIADKRKSIDTIRRDIGKLNTSISNMGKQLNTLQAELDDRKEKFVKSMRYMHRNRSIQNQLMFIFSAKNLTQMYRRLRFTREYATFQRAQGEAVKTKQAQIEQKQAQLKAARNDKDRLLYKGVKEQEALESKQTEQEQVVATLKKQQKTIQNIIAQQQKKDAALNAEIDRLVAIEVEKARQRAIAEAKRKAAEAEARKRAAELARKKAAAEAAARANAQRIAEAKKREEELKEAARKASAERRKEAERAAREAERDRKEAERAAKKEAKERARELAKAKETDEAAFSLNNEDRRISGNFESNRGRLPMPITGPYRIVSHFGQYNVEGLKNVRLDNKGINILGQPGAQARSIFDGEVSAVFSLGGTTGVMVRHGSYISVYCNLSSVSVHRGQRVSARQALGTVASDNILQFQLRRETAKLNPESWLGR